MKSILNTLATVVIVIVQVVFWASFAKMNGWRLSAPLKALSEFMRCRGKVGSLFFAALIAITGIVQRRSSSLGRRPMRRR